MSYLTDPNTRRLATTCCICRRSLRDATSVEIGIGPVCRQKYGFAEVYDNLSGTKKKNVNKLIHEAGVACEANDVSEVLRLADKIEKRGFGVVASKVRAHYVRIRIKRAEVEEFGWEPGRGEFSLGRQHKVLQVWTPYSPEFNDCRRSERLRGRPCKVKTEYGKFHWEFKADAGIDLMRVLVQTFPGHAMATDKGVATIPTPAEFDAKYVPLGAQPLT